MNVERLPVTEADLKSEAANSLTVSVAGVPFVGHYQIGADGLDERRVRRETAEALLWYVNEFVFFGCGGPYHDFPGDATDRLKHLECLKCGAEKRLNMIYDAKELRRVFVQADVDPEITKTLRPGVAMADSQGAGGSGAPA